MFSFDKKMEGIARKFCWGSKLEETVQLICGYYFSGRSFEKQHIIIPNNFIKPSCLWVCIIGLLFFIFVILTWLVWYSRVFIYVRVILDIMHIALFMVKHYIISCIEPFGKLLEMTDHRFTSWKNTSWNIHHWRKWNWIWEDIPGNIFHYQM